MCRYVMWVYRWISPKDENSKSRSLNKKYKNTGRLINMTDRELLELLLQKVTGVEQQVENMNKIVSDVPAMKVAIFETSDTLKHLDKKFLLN